MFRKLITAALAATAASALVVLPATSAEARPGCVTRFEYHSIGNRPFGMTRERVTRIFDTNGRTVLSLGRGQSRDIWVKYPACNGRSFVEINFDNYSHFGRNLRMYHKDWHWNF